MLSVPLTPGPQGQLQLHATTVVAGSKAMALAGVSGAGKSSLALAMMGRGAVLLADDVTWLRKTASGVEALCPPALSGQIEARGLGILTAPTAPPSPLAAIVDLVPRLTERLPRPKTQPVFGHGIPVFHMTATSLSADALMHYLLHGLAEVSPQ